MTAALAYKCLVDVGVQVVVALPDSKLAPLCKVVKANNDINYIQTVDECIGAGIAAGLSVTGTKSIVVMENSGLRSACETLARLHISHQLFAVFLISNRGAFGERNWWGMAHYETMEPLLRLLRFRWEYVRSISEFSNLLKAAYSTAQAGQCSVALIAEPTFTDELML